MDKTVIKAFQVFEQLCRHDGPVSLSELARETSLQKSNIHRILSTLAHLGYVRQEGTPASYRPTLKTWTLGSIIRERYDVASLGRPSLIALREEFGETVYIAIMDGDHLVYVDVVDGTHRVRVNARTGGSAPLHCTASGKVLLAHAPDDVIDSLPEPFERFGPGTPTTRAELRKRAAQARRQGYAINKEEWVEGVTGIAVPIRDARGQYIAAIGIAGLAIRLNKEPTEKIIESLQHHAAEISAKLGFRGGA